jgi:raffinose/stachyose/melibiose transport system substrate-binding protein
MYIRIYFFLLEDSMKRAVVVFVLLLAFVSPTMIFGGGRGQQTGGSVVTIEMVMLDSQLEKFYADAVAKFEATHPNIKVTQVFKESNTGTFPYVSTLAQSGSEGADLFPTDGNKTIYMGNFADAGIIQSLDGKLDISGFPPLMVQRSKHKGHLYTSPGVFGDVFPIFYNKDIFTKYNLQIPNSFEELETINKTLMANGVQPFTLDGLSVWGVGWNFWNFVGVFAPEWTENFCKGIGNFDDPQFRLGMQRMKAWADAGYFGPNWQSLDSTGATMEFTSGQAAMFCNIVNMHDACEAAGMNFGAFYWPMPGGGKYMMAGQAMLSGYALRATGNKAKEDAALELIKYLMSDEVNQILGDMNWKVPYKSTITTTSPVLNSLRTADRIVPLWSDQMTSRTYDNVNGYSILNDYAQRYFFGSVTLDQAIAEFMKIIDPRKTLTEDEKVSWNSL